MTDIRPPQDSIVSGAFWGRNPHGELRWLHTRAQCFRDADGRPLRLAGATVDITEAGLNHFLDQ